MTATTPSQRASEPSEPPPLLMLCHRIPYPPNKGDKIRSFNLLKYLSAHFAIYLGTFVDDPADEQYLADLEPFCESICAESLSPASARLRSVLGLVTGDPLSLAFYRGSGLKRWTEDTVSRHAIERGLVFSSVMGQFLPTKHKVQRLVIDFVDVDSDKWTQYAESKSWPVSWLYRREGARLLRWERELAHKAHISLFVSQAEASLFREYCPELGERVSHFDNGVDDSYFSPSAAGESPYPSNARTLVFTGVMDYWPNVDAVTHFANDIFPQLRAELPELEFWIVGSKPTPAVQALAGGGVVVTGRVDDVRPYLAHALAAVAPLRIARGVQNKVLEAMAMARPVLVSRQGLEGIAAEHDKQLIVCESVDDYQVALATLGGNRAQGLGIAARAYVQMQANWDSNLQSLLPHLGIEIKRDTPTAGVAL